MLIIGSYRAGDYTTAAALSPDDGKILWSAVMGADTLRIGVTIEDIPNRGITIAGFANATNSRSPLVYRPFIASLSKNKNEFIFPELQNTNHSAYFFSDDRSITITRDGGFATLSAEPYQGLHIINLRKFDSTGEFQFEKLYDTLQSSDQKIILSFIETKDKGFAALYTHDYSRPDSMFFYKVISVRRANLEI